MKNHIKKRQRERIKQLQVHRQLPDKPKEQTVHTVQTVQIQNDPEYEWKHGGVNPWGQERKSKQHPILNYLTRGVLLSLVLFAMIWVFFQLPYSWAEPGKQSIRYLLNDEWPAEQVVKLYEKWLGGNPTLIPTFQPEKDTPFRPAQANNHRFQPPLKGEIVQTYAPEHRGLRFVAQENRVTAVGEGRVMYVADEPSTRSLVLIQHVDGIESLYGNLDSISIKQNDWVRIGQPIGYLANESDSESILFFAMKRDDEFINPADVIEFD